MADITPLTVYATGDTDYISNMNADNLAIAAYVNVLGGSLEGAAGAESQLPLVAEALFGASTSVIGIDSYKMTGAGAILTILAGFAYLNSNRQVVQLAADTTLDFTGLAADTYYVQADFLGSVVKGTISNNDELYSVVWTGAAFGAITLLAKVRWGSDDFGRALISTALATTYDRLDDRLEGGELGGTAVISTALAAGDDTLTTAEFVEAICQVVTGAPGAARTLNVPALPKLFCLDNNLTGTFGLTVQVTGGGGASVALEDGDEAVIYCDGTDCILISHQPARPTGIQTQEGWIDDTSLTFTGVAIPANHIMLRTTIEAAEAFDSDGTDLVRSGNAGDDDGYTQDVDVSTTGLKTPTAGVELGLVSTSAKTPQMTYAAGGSAATTGKVHGVWEYVLISPTPA